MTRRAITMNPEPSAVSVLRHRVRRARHEHAHAGGPAGAGLRAAGRHRAREGLLRQRVIRGSAADAAIGVAVQPDIRGDGRGGLSGLLPRCPRPRAGSHRGHRGDRPGRSALPSDRDGRLATNPDLLRERPEAAAAGDRPPVVRGSERPARTQGSGRSQEGPRSGGRAPRRDEGLGGSGPRRPADTGSGLP